MQRTQPMQTWIGNALSVPLLRLDGNGGFAPENILLGRNLCLPCLQGPPKQRGFVGPFVDTNRCMLLDVYRTCLSTARCCRHDCGLLGGLLAPQSIPWKGLPPSDMKTLPAGHCTPHTAPQCSTTAKPKTCSSKWPVKCNKMRITLHN